jgi:lipoprotein-releasing system permease protein
LNLELFIAGRLVRRSKGNFSRPVVNLAVASIGIGLAVMIASVAIVTGFQTQISDKVTGFGGHIQVTRYDENMSYEPSPVSIHQKFYPEFKQVGAVRHIQVFASKAGIIKTDSEIDGVVFKGVGPDFDWSFFSGNITDGSRPDFKSAGPSPEVIVSRKTAGRLLLKTGDDLRMYFLGTGTNQLRGRKFRISGIYESGLDEFDRLYVLGDIRHIQRLNGWDTTMVAGFELYVDDLGRLQQTAEDVYQAVGYELNARTITELYPQLFDWLRLQDMNVIIILILMIAVSAITMTSTLLILILERTNMIGVFKSMGMRNRNVRELFIYIAAFILSRGLIIGNLIGIGTCLLQQYTGLIRLPQESYYVSVVPVNLDVAAIVMLNIGTALLCLLMLIVPTFIITRISPLKAIVLR